MAAGDGVSIARSYRDAPEIDGFVVVEKELPVGQDGAGDGHRRHGVRSGRHARR